MKNCELNTCSERIAAQCVLLSCPNIGESGYIILEGCNPTLCDYLSRVDNIITELKDADGIYTPRLSTSCTFIRIDDLILTRDATYHKVKTSDTIITLLNIICDLKLQIDCMLQGDCIWNLPLHPDILNGPLLETCIGNNNPCGPLIPTTLKELIISMMHKICKCCP